MANVNCSNTINLKSIPCKDRHVVFIGKNGLPLMNGQSFNIGSFMPKPTPIYYGQKYKL